ncbi:kinase-like domain-containing protein [Dichotomocladium elegans]|nr:kinase-like domain-containing protein [Dichotomocladium elegans]
MLDNKLDILKQVKHTHITSMHNLYEDQDAYAENNASRLLRHVHEGLAYLHELTRIVHRGIKTENLLFESQNDSIQNKLMITDFGLSRILKDHDDILMTACGTPGYVEPEILSRAGHGTVVVDLWSVGIIMISLYKKLLIRTWLINAMQYTILCGYTPSWGQDEVALLNAVHIDLNVSESYSS